MNPPSDSSSPPAEAVAAAESQVIEIWRGILQVRDIPPGSKFFDLGGDSLKAMEFSAEIGRRFGRDLPVLDLVGNTTTEIAVKLAQEQKKPGAFARLARKFLPGR